MRIGYIYLFTNLITGKKYAGQTKEKNPWNRINAHRREARHGSMYPIHCASRKYGWDNFYREIIWTGDAVELNDREVFYVKKHKCFIDDGHGYNLTRGGLAKTKFAKSVKAKISRGRKLYFENPENRKLQSKAVKQSYADDPTRGPRIGASNLGRKPSPSAKKAQSLGQKRRYEDPAQREVASLLAKKRFVDHPELREVSAAVNRGKKASAATKAKVSASLKEYYKDPVKRAFAGNSKRGKKASAAANLANSIAQKKRWEDPTHIEKMRLIRVANKQKKVRT